MRLTCKTLHRGPYAVVLCTEIYWHRFVTIDLLQPFDPRL